MTTGSGIDGQVGLVTESVYGTAVTVTRFHEVTGAAIQPETVVVAPKLVGRGLFRRSDRRKTVVVGGNGKFTTLLLTKGCGVLLKHMTGSVATLQVGSTDEYTHTFTPDTANGMRGLSATVQVGLPFVGGTVQPMTGTGGKINAWKLTAAVNDAVMIETEWLFRTILTNVALATDTYPTSAEMLTFDQITFTVDGDAQEVSSVELSATNALADGRRYLGAPLRAEPLANDEWEYGGKFTIEWSSLDTYNAWISGTAGTLVLTATGGTIPEESNPFKSVITIKDVFFTGEVPELSGPDILSHDVPFEAASNGTDPVFKWVYHTTDTTP
jgi:hypothetical protein